MGVSCHILFFKSSSNSENFAQPCSPFIPCQVAFVWLDVPLALFSVLSLFVPPASQFCGTLHAINPKPGSDRRGRLRWPRVCSKRGKQMWLKQHHSKQQKYTHVDTQPGLYETRKVCKIGLDVKSVE